MKTAETKYVSTIADDATPNTYSSFNSIISGATQFSCAMPTLQLGTNAYTRIGDLIQPTSLKVALDVRIKGGTSSTGNPVDLTVVLYYGYCKKYKNWNDVNTNSATLANQLLSTGGISALTSVDTQPFAGLQSDSHLPVNSTIWKLKKKTVRLFKCPGYLNGATSPGLLAGPSKYNHTFFLDYTDMLPAKLKYEDGDPLPENFAPVWSMGYYYNDATAPNTTAGSGILEFKTNNMLYFKDI